MRGDAFLVDTDDTDQDHTDAHRSENGACLLCIEVVVGTKNEWHRTELQVEDCPAERYPQREEEDHWLGEKHI